MFVQQWKQNIGRILCTKKLQNITHKNTIEHHFFRKRGKPFFNISLRPPYAIQTRIITCMIDRSYQKITIGKCCRIFPYVCTKVKNMTAWFTSTNKLFCKSIHIIEKDAG